MSEEKAVNQVQEKPNDKSAPESTSFASQAEQQAPGIVAEFWEFLIYNKKWWLAPIVIVLLLLGIIIALAGSWAAPFIYPAL